MTLDAGYPSAVAPRRYPGQAGVPRPRGGHRWLRRAAVTVLVVPALAAVGLVTLWPLTPSVGDAEHRIAALLAVHGEKDPHALPVPDPVGTAVIATEDSRFYLHRGIDPIAVGRAAFRFGTGASDPGGATLDQQLAKNLYAPDASGPAAKVEQVELAVKLDTTYPKQQILQMYLAVVYFGHGLYGLSAAARGYFGLPPSELSWAQASLLAGLLQAPSAYDPYVHPDLARQRQRHVLSRLVATGVLTQAASATAYAAPWHLRPA